MIKKGYSITLLNIVWSMYDTISRSKYLKSETLDLQCLPNFTYVFVCTNTNEDGLWSVREDRYFEN